MANYLYNGIELPPLPDLNYPYAYITQISSSSYYALHTFPSYSYEISDMGYWRLIYPEQEYYSYRDGYDGWELQTWASGPGGIVATDIEWSNINILNSDGSIYLPASYPINAETGEEIHDYEPVPVPVVTKSSLILYKNNSEPIVVGKSLTKIATINGNLRDSTDIVNPEITIKYSKVPDFNYLYYDELKRYYFVDSIESIVTNVWKLGLHVDVLETYKQDIWNCRGLVERNEFTYNPLLVDTAQAYESGYNIEVIDGNINIGGNITGIETPCYMIVGTQLSNGRALV